MLDGKAEGNGGEKRRSRAFMRFERLTKKLLPVTKQQIAEAELQRKKRPPRGNRSTP